MKLELEVYSALCATETFKINNIDADNDDFGNSYDASPETAEDYGCGNRVFKSKLATQEVLDRYKISVDEYNEVCEQLQDKLSFGNCGWCV